MITIKRTLALALSVIMSFSVMAISPIGSAQAVYSSAEEANELLNDIIYDVLKEYDGETVDEIVDKVVERLEEETYGGWTLTAEGRLALYYRVESFLEEFKNYIEKSKNDTEAETKPVETKPVTVPEPIPEVKEELSVFGEVEYTDTFTLSNSEFNNITVSLKNNRLTITGVFTIEGLNGILFSLFDMNDVELCDIDAISLTTGESFTCTYDLSKINGLTSEMVLKYYTRTDKSTDGDYWSPYYDFLVLKKVNGAYRLVQTPNIEENIQALSAWVNPVLCINVKPDSSITWQANNICEGLTGDYEKAFAIYTWICSKIHYDRDFVNGKKNQTSTSFYDMLGNRLAKNRGYADLLEAMLESQGIPAIITTVYSQDVINMLKGVEAEYVDYAVEAYIDGRWVVMLPFLDHNMELVDGKSVCARPRAYSYFDITMQAYSASFYLHSRRTETSANTPSDWALSEIVAANAQKIVPDAIQSNYRNSISRAEFCALIMQMLRIKHGVNDVRALLAIYATDYSDNFSDTNDMNANGAYLLGIVSGRGNGKFDPNSTITRQEAAVMLANTAKFLGIMPSSKMDISDIDLADDWARDSIKTVTGLVSSTGKTVMNGVDLTRFSPKTQYTREQSILTVYRLFMCE